MINLRRIIFAGLLAIVPAATNAQTNDLADGLLAFSCAFPEGDSVFVLEKEQTSWNVVGASDGFLVTEVADGFRFEEANKAWIAFLQRDAGDSWRYRGLEESELLIASCSNLGVLVSQLAGPIAGRVVENAELLAEQNALLEQQLSEANGLLAEKQASTARLEERVQLLEAELSFATGGDTTEGQGIPLNDLERGAFLNEIGRCWNVGAGSIADRTSIEVRFDLEPDGTVRGNEVRLFSSDADQSATSIAFEAARRAILRCAGDGYDLPAEKYDQWRSILLAFGPFGIEPR